MLMAARRLADGGSLRMAAELCDELLTDDRISGVLGVRVRGLIRLPISFEAGGDDEEETPEEEALEADFWKMFPENDLVDLCKWGVLLGVGVGEQVWEEHEGRVIPRLKVWNPRWLRFDWPTREWRLTVEGEGEITIAPGDGKWILYMPHGSNRPWAHAPWKFLGVAWVIKKYAIGDFAGSSQAAGQAVKVGTAPEGASAETRREFAASLKAMMGGSSVAFPPGYDAKLLESMSTSWQQFPQLIAWADTAAAIIIAGQNLTTEVTGGSFAAAAVHASIAHHLVESDEQTLSTTLHDQSLTWWTEFNFGDASRAPWARWDVTPPADLAAEATTLQAVGTAITSLRDAGLRVDAEAMARRFGIPLLEEPVEEDPFAALLKSFESRSSSKPAPAKAQGWRKVVTLASGREGPQSFEDGAEFVAAVAQKAREAAAEAMGRDVAKVRELIEGATDPDALRAALTAHYAEMDPADLAELTRRALLLAELAGRLAVVEEVVDAQ